MFTATSQPASITEPERDSTKPKGLSEGAKIGIGVAVPLVLIAIAAVCWLFYRRGQHSAGYTTEDNVYYFPTTHQPHELADNKIPTAHELVGTKMMPEMEGVALPRG